MIFYMVDHSNRRNLKRWLSHGPQRISNFLLSQGENLPPIESKLLGLSKKFLEVLSMTFFCKMKYDHNKNEVTSRFHWKISGAIDSSMYNGHGKLVQTLTYSWIMTMYVVSPLMTDNSHTHHSQDSMGPNVPWHVN